MELTKLNESRRCSEIMDWDTWIKESGNILMGSLRMVSKDVAVKTRPASRRTPARICIDI